MKNAPSHNQSLSIGILGCNGRVGARLVSLLQSKAMSDHLTLAGGTSRNNSHHNDFFMTNDPAALFAKSNIVIDFTTPQATQNHIEIARAQQKPIVIGTTGLSDDLLIEIQKASKHCPILYSANMSVGINLLSALVQKAAQTLGPEWDIEILETHHKHKVDAPSGTALLLGKAASAGRDIPFDSAPPADRKGARAQDGSVGYAVMRGGDVAGEHFVSFFGEKERLELSHRATDRDIFARGALKAAMWLAGKPNGFYNMQDVFDL